MSPAVESAARRALVLASAGAASDRPVAVWCPHPLVPAQGRVLVMDPLIPGESLAEYLERTGLARAIGRQPVVATLDGHRLPRELWRHARPRPGVLIHLQAVVQGGGGGGGKNPIATVLSLAIAVFNPAVGILGKALAGTTIIGSLTVGQVFNFALGLAVNALFPPPRPQISDAQGQNAGSNDSPTYSLAGGGNRARTFEPLPMIAGTHRVFADLGAKTFTEFEGQDQYLYQIFEFGYNTVSLSDWKIGTTPIASFSDITLEESGTDGALTLFPGNVDTIAGGALEVGTPVQRTSSPGSTAIAVELVGNSFGIGGSGLVQGLDCEFNLEYRAVGSSTWLPLSGGAALVSVRGADGDRAPMRLTYKLAVALGQYEVRVERLTATPVASGATYVMDFSWSQLRSYQPDTADYTGRKRVAAKMKAAGQLSGQVEQLSAVARAQCLAWNGAAWVLGETSNPAWWFRAVALGRFVTLDGVSRRVWGAGLAAGRVDDDSIQAWGAWCTTKSLTFNGVFDRAMSAADMLNAICACGRASMTWANGKLGVVWDEADQPVTAVFGMANIVAGSFEISYATAQLADEVIVSFINPDLDWQRDTVRCLVPGTVTPTRTRTLELFGCTDLDMAGRAGNLYAAQNAYRIRRYKWHADWEGMAASRGDVVALSHDLASYDYSGRLVEGSTASSLKLDRAVPLETGGAYIVIIKPDQTFDTYPVNGGSGDSDTLTQTSALPFNPGTDADHPVFDYKYLYGPASTPGRLVKIDAIRPLDERTVELTAVDEADVFYAAEDADYVYTVPRPTYGGASISNLQVTETGIRVPPGYMVQLAVTWDAQADYSGAEVFAAVDGGPELSRGTTRGTRVDFIVADGAIAQIRVVAHGTLGRLSSTTTLTVTHETDFASAQAPADVSTFLISDDVLSWLPVGDVDVAGYRVRFNYGRNASWSAATPLHEGLLTASPWQMPVRPAGAVTLLIKAVDVAAIESLNAAPIYTDLSDPVVEKVVETFDLDAAGYPGTLTGGTVSGGDLMASSTGKFWPASDTGAFWPPTDDGHFWPAVVYGDMVYEASVTPTTTTTGATMTIAATVTAQRYTIEYRPQSQGKFWPASDSGSFWDNSADKFWPAAPDYRPWPGSLVVSEREPYDIRITTAGGGTQGVVSALTVSIDIPFVDESFADLVIAAGGTRLPITGSYRGIDNVQVTLQNDGGSAIGVRIEDKDASLGPLIKTINSAGTGVAGLVDATIRGY